MSTQSDGSGVVPADKLVARYNALNRQIVHGLPELARAYVTLHAHLPLLREMQTILSQRPAGSAGGSDFTILQRAMGKTVRIAMPAATRYDLPTWTYWLQQYARAIDYSVRHIRRLVMGEAKQKIVKECGWSVSDHNNLIRAVTAAFDLVNAIDAGADTFVLVEELRNLMRSVDDEILSKPYEPEKKTLPKRAARRVTDDDG